MAILIHQLLDQAFAAGSSDLIMSSGSPPAIRVEGNLRALDEPALDGAQITTAIEAFASVPQREHWRKNKHLDFAGTYQGRRMRGSASWSRGAANLVLRLLPAKVPSAKQLGLPTALTGVLERNWGLVMITGPAGHGKTTTCASLIDIINKKSMKHIVTVEDPIEYVHTRAESIVSHQEIGSDSPSFKAALKQILRHSPDVIFLGEIRDRESMEAALTVAETGHLVFTTMHANDSVQALDRIASFFPRDQQTYVWGQLAMVLAVVANQRLLPGKDGKRVLATELLMNSNAVANLIREGRTAQLHSVLETERQNGSQSMNIALKQLVDAGRVHLAGARAYLNPLETDVLPQVGEPR